MDLNLNDDWSFNAMLEGGMNQYSAHIAHSSPTLSSTAYTVDDDESSQIIPETQPTQRKPKKGNFTVDEDIDLISAWLNTSMNPRKGTNQTGKSFWNDITKTFCDSTGTERTDRLLNCRFGEIQKAVNKFIGQLAQVENSGHSGHTEQDKIQKAKSTYAKIHNCEFRFEHCWNILKNQPKWMETEGLAGRRKHAKDLTQSKDSSAVPSPVEVDKEGNFIYIERPMETKVAINQEKKKKKQKGENDAPLGSFIADWKVQKQKMHDDKMKIEEEKLAMAKRDEELRMNIEQEKLAMAKRDEELRKNIEEEKMAMAKRNEELRIMTMDLTNLDGNQKEYIMILRANILEKSRNQR